MLMDCVIMPSPTGRIDNTYHFDRLFPIPPSLPPRICPQGPRMKLPGFTGSSSVSVSVEPTASRSAIALSSAYRLQLLPLFDRFGRYACDVTLSVPTRSGSYTSRVSLECLHESNDTEIVLGPDWMSACSVTPCSDGPGLEDPTPAIVGSLPAGHYWTPSEGMRALPFLRAVD